MERSTRKRNSPRRLYNLGLFMQHITPEWLGSLGIEYTPITGPYFYRETLSKDEPDGPLYRAQLFHTETEEEMWSYLRSAAALYIWNNEDILLYDIYNPKEREEFKAKPGYYIACWCVQLELSRKRDE